MPLFSIQEKDKKKGRGKNKATKDKSKSKEENEKDQGVTNTVQTVSEAKMATSSIVANSKTRNTKNVPAPHKADITKEPQRKLSLAGIKSNTQPKRLPPIEQHKKANPSSKEAAGPRRKKTPQGPPQVNHN